MNCQSDVSTKAYMLLALSISLLLIFAFFLVSCGNEGSTGNAKNSQHTPKSDEQSDSMIQQKMAEAEMNHAFTNALHCLREPSTTDNDEAQNAAMNLLSDYPSPEVISLLVEKALSVTTPHYFKFDDQTFTAYAALSKIGGPAVPRICDQFEKTTNASEQLLLLDIMIKIKGRDWVMHYLLSLNETNKQSHTANSYQRLYNYAKASHSV